MKKKYEKVHIEITEIEVEDITTSTQFSKFKINESENGSINWTSFKF